MKRKKWGRKQKWEWPNTIYTVYIYNGIHIDFCVEIQNQNDQIIQPYVCDLIWSDLTNQPTSHPSIYLAKLAKQLLTNHHHSYDRKTFSSTRFFLELINNNRATTWILSCEKKNFGKFKNPSEKNREANYHWIQSTMDNDMILLTWNFFFLRKKNR